MTLMRDNTWSALSCMRGALTGTSTPSIRYFTLKPRGEVSKWMSLAALRIAS